MRGGLVCGAMRGGLVCNVLLVADVFRQSSLSKADTSRAGNAPIRTESMQAYPGSARDQFTHQPFTPIPATAHIWAESMQACPGLAHTHFTHPLHTYTTKCSNPGRTHLC
eukprot:140030-Chlamydomonas_euryale.AAC.2